MIPRQISDSILKATNAFPIIGIVGPRQSGKTTLAKNLFSDFEYVNLEQPDTRQFAQNDPRGFLNRYPQKAIFDEIQRVPELFSYLQVHIDNTGKNNQYVLTGSQHFLMMESISQTLAGRIALFNLLPFSLAELKQAHQQESSLLQQILKGGYPRLYDQPVEPSLWLSNYIQTYLDRDVRQLSQVASLETFEKFVQLVAGRSGQILNLSSLGSDVGVTHNTIKSWVSLLQTSGIISLIKPYFSNIKRRLNKSPKVFLNDSGLLCYLLGITTENQLKLHPLYGNIFETFIVTEFIKHKFNSGENMEIFYFRDQTGLEADLLIQANTQTKLYEIKSSQTIPSDTFDNLIKISKILPQKPEQNLIYGGIENQNRTEGNIISWQNVF